jgi:Flp pilus assembly protein TadB
MTMWVLLVLAPLLLLAMMGLSHDFVAPMFTDSLGRMMLMLGAGLQIVGWLLLKKIVVIEV